MKPQQRITNTTSPLSRIIGLLCSYYLLLLPIFVTFSMVAIATDSIMDDLEKELENDIITLKQVHVITRHGSRLPSVKRADNLTEVSAGMLTATGEKQMFELGQWLKNRYNEALDGQFIRYVPNQVRFESSQVDRTIVSAMSLAAGLYDAQSRDPHDENMLDKLEVGPMRPVVPIYTLEEKHDIYIRAYDKCPKYIDDLNILYDSYEWKQLETDNAELLRKLASVPLFQHYKDNASGLIPLKELYNIYDIINVAFTECDVELEPQKYNKVSDMYNRSSRACYELGYSVDDFITLFNSDFDFDYAFTNLTHQIELIKYGTETAGKLLGGNLMGRIVERMFGVDTGTTETVYVYSGHYETILGIFAAMDDIIEMDLEVIPTYSSALIFELYEMNDSAGTKIVKMLYRDGDYGKNTVFDHLPWGEICTGDTCPLDTLLEYIVKTVNIDNWCTVCNNTIADICLEQQVDICEQDLEAAMAVQSPPLQDCQQPSSSDANNVTNSSSSTESNGDVASTVGKSEDNNDSTNDINGDNDVKKKEEISSASSDNTTAYVVDSTSTEDHVRGVFTFGFFMGLLFGYLPVLIWYLVQRKKKLAQDKEHQKLRERFRQIHLQKKKISNKKGGSSRSAQQWPSRSDMQSIGEMSLEELSIVDLNDDAQSTTADENFVGSYLI